jgi:hypothetical protein
MVEVTTKVEGSPQTPSQRVRARAERLRKLHTRPGVRVVPANDDMRRLLKHPKAGNFRSEGSLEWPNDSFTQRRLRDGSVKLAEAEEREEKPKSGRSHHQRSE